MKKLLVIVVLGLLLSGNAYAKKIKVVSKSPEFIIFKVGKGMADNWGKNSSEQNKNLSYVTSIAKKHCRSYSKTMYLFGAEPHDTNLSPFWYDQEMGGMFSFRSRFICANSLDEAFNIFNSSNNFQVMINGSGWTTKYSNTDWRVSSFKKINISNSNTTSTSQSTGSSTNDKIAQSKQICRDLGFKTNTEKFADCALKMMSIQFEATNKVASSSGGTTQEIIVKHKQDYDIFDAMLDMSNALLSNGNNSSSSSSNNNTRCVIGRTNPTFGTTTMNCN